MSLCSPPLRLLLHLCHTHMKTLAIHIRPRCEIPGHSTRGTLLTCPHRHLSLSLIRTQRLHADSFGQIRTIMVTRVVTTIALGKEVRPFLTRFAIPSSSPSTATARYFSKSRFTRSPPKIPTKWTSRFATLTCRYAGMMTTTDFNQVISESLTNRPGLRVYLTKHNSQEGESVAGIVKGISQLHVTEPLH